MKNRKKEVDNVCREKLNTVIAFIVITAVIILTAMVALLTMLQHDFEKAETKFFEGFTLSSPPELWERVPDLYIYPWSEYHKYSTRELSQEQSEFLQTKRVAECMVDMVNYEEVLISNRENAVSLLYNEARRLLTDDDKEYYVWNEIQIEGVYLFGMVNMKGEIFSFHYVTDMKCEEEEAIQYVEDSFEGRADIYGLNDETNVFSNNRNFYLKFICEKLEEYENLDTTIFYQDINFRKKPSINGENGTAILIYISETKEDYFIFLYLDCKTKKISGYHLMLY